MVPSKSEGKLRIEIVGCHRQLRKITKARRFFPLPKPLAKFSSWSPRDLRKAWKKPIVHWPAILNQSVIRFDDRLPV